MNTYWSQPKTNIFSAMLNLRGALATGINARLIRINNEDCAYPIRISKSNVDLDFKSYEFNTGKLNTVNKIKTSAKTFGDRLSLDYMCCYGNADAVETYYKTGVLTSDNFKGQGWSHLVNIDDAINFFKKVDDDRAEKFYNQYRDVSKFDESHFFDSFTLKNATKTNKPKHFKRKVWAVEILSDNVPKARTPMFIHIINALAYPLKFIPNKSVLRMPDYTLYTFRIGGVSNGYSIEFHIPKKFGFK